MGKYNFLSQFVVDKSSEKSDSQQRHIFYKVSDDDVIKAEQRMGKKIPAGLKEFYREIGYGFICKDDNTRTNRIMHPDDIADFYLGNEQYQYVDRDVYEEYEMVFFDLGGEGDFLTMDVGDTGSTENCSIFYFGEKIASDLVEFLKNMDASTNYYIKK